MPRLSFKQRLQRQAKIAARPPSKAELAESARQERALADLIAMSEGQSQDRQARAEDWDGPRILVERTHQGLGVVFVREPKPWEEKRHTAEAAPPTAARRRKR